MGSVLEMIVGLLSVIICLAWSNHVIRDCIKIKELVE